MIPTSSLVTLGFTALFCSLLPFISAFIWTRKKEKSMKPFFIGAAFYIFFVLIIESVLNELIFQNEFLFNNTLFYIVYSCLAAAFIEEGSRITITWGDTDQATFISVFCDKISGEDAMTLANEIIYIGSP